jgi:hypothetical protein
MPTIEKKDFSVKEKTENWFTDFIHSLEVKKLTYSSNTLKKEDQFFFEGLATKSQDQLLEDMMITSQKFYFTKIISEFFNVLLNQKKSRMPKKIAFNHKGKQIMAWFEISNGDEIIEDNIFIAEAIVNSNFENSGFSISATVVEEEDNLEIPGHYQILKT